MMYQIAVCFSDSVTAKKIMETNDVAKCRKLGRQVSNYDDRIWNGLRQIVVYEGLVAKFSQNEDLKHKILATGDSVLAECNPADRIWGVGLSTNSPERLDISKWRGQNLLGFSLMMARSKIATS